MSEGCLDGVCGCLRVSGSYLGVSGICLGEYRCHINHKQLNRSRHIAFSPSDLPRQKVLHFGVSVGCLEGVCKVSGGCLGDSEYCLGGYNAKSIDKSSLGIILISWFLFSQWLPIGQIWRKIQIFKRVFAAEGVLKSKNWRKQISLKIKFPIQFQLCGSRFWNLCPPG